MSQLTTHILDTTRGRPATNVSVTLFYHKNEHWEKVVTGITNQDGRIPGLIPAEQVLDHGTYKLLFETSAYFSNQGISSFYPFVEIVFTIDSSEHYHVPLLLNPFGYSTYRGS
ncbi:MAG: hydroxyisourate hydrolase [Bacteroidetes bacterium]|nr:hydroxyisourate hydrolase [Bacteroidota bacterium]